MFVLAALDIAALLLGIAALVSALGGVASTIIALRKSNDEAHEQCLERLKTAREDAEKAMSELHDLKMGKLRPGLEAGDGQ